MPNSNKIKKNEKNELLNSKIIEIGALYEIIKKDIEEGNFTTSLEEHFIEIDNISDLNDFPTSGDIDKKINNIKKNDLNRREEIILAFNQTQNDLKKGNYTIETADEHIVRLWSEK